MKTISIFGCRAHSEFADLEFVTDSPARSPIANCSVLDPPPFHIIVADLGIVCIGLLSTGEHPATAQIINTQDPLYVRHSL